MPSNAESFAELGMATELAIVVAGAVGGLNRLRGTVVMNGVTPVTVTNANLAAGDFVQFMIRTVSGTVGPDPFIATRTNGTGFTVAASAGNTSTYEYRITKG